LFDHDILVQRLQTRFGNDATIKMLGNGFGLYLSGRTHYDRRCSTRPSSVNLVCGVPQCLLLGPVQFILYIADSAALIEERGLLLH
jgi:hypothetical protein